MKELKNNTCLEGAAALNEIGITNIDWIQCYLVNEIDAVDDEIEQLSEAEPSGMQIMYLRGKKDALEKTLEEYLNNK